MTGHVMEGIAKNFTGQVTVVNLVANWQGTSKVFEYYRRTLDPERGLKKSHFCLVPVGMNKNLVY